ncbi:MAG: nicotinamide-nucleotide amidohydrolase family protein [Beijerinckiaceae bacterium]|nr:nicotinamide-nucleotide amidohydrolase family protein [Beijerinckiaceae bacterium]MCZ8299751.1 nicotinamide-nucleotide amidohydrolase family protein [Beijerinckiaceae bacterium]
MPRPLSPARLAREVLALARARGLTIATAESCTGGLVAAALTSIAGSSDVMDRGFVTYSNAAKTAMLGVPAPLIASVGAVSAEVAAAMAEGALRASGAGLAVSITGIAGPGGGSATKPVGLVHFAAAARDGRVNRVDQRFDPALGRAGIRRAACLQALLMLRDMAQESSITA